MADNVAALYPQPPQQNTGILSGDPTRALGAIGQLNQIAQFNSEYKSRQAIGSAYRNALRADGTIDQGALAAGLRHPDAAYGLPQTMSQVIAQRGGQIANDTAQFEQKAKQNQFLLSGLGALANKPDLSREDVNNFIVTAARNTNVPSDILMGWMRSLPRDPKALRSSLVTLGNLARGAESTLSPTSAPIGYTPEGAPISGTAGAYPYAASGAGGPGAPRPAPPPAGGGAPFVTPAPRTAAPAVAAGIAAPAPGLAGSVEKLALSGADAANRLRDANDSSMTRKGMLGNLEEDLQHFTSGPGADWTKFSKAWVNRNLPLPKGWEFDPKSIASQEQFNKQAAMLAQQQFEAIGGTGTDAKFNSAFTTSPNETLSGLGNQGIIRLLKGNEDAIQAKNKAWLQWKKQFGANTYDEFSQDFASRFDPRAFQFKYLTPRERQSYIDRMDPRDRAGFISALTAAHKSGWISFDGSR